MSRFSEPQDPLFRALNSSIAFDYRLVPYDLEQSVAPARMLARSRNDQVATDIAMMVRAHALSANELLIGLMSTIVAVAERHLDWPMPGYTHLQRAQPVYLSHHLLAYFWMFRRDARRFEGVLGSTTELPLGAGALA